MPVLCATRTDGNALVVTLAGTLGRRDAAQVRACLLRGLAEQPAALFADVTRLSMPRPATLGVFWAVARQAARWPGAPFALVGPMPAKAPGRVQVFASMDAARDHFRGRPGTLAEMSDELLPVAGAARRSRDVATEACLRWDLPRLIGPASVIAGEFAANVVDHAGTMAALRLALHDRFLTISVRDGSLAGPARCGRGLRLVEAFARHWGCLPAAGGKVVWATLPRTPIG